MHLPVSSLFAVFLLAVVLLDKEVVVGARSKRLVIAFVANVFIYTYLFDKTVIL